ncbi:MAG TPA: aminotransferase class III-fold pyridoxal phosphate-dependent enzyme [Actinomycetota bacterium]|nr:aminotransferase class III-fold pyridoxal phosphate-dependent enzyme [Actinomycetota bacterium]
MNGPNVHTSLPGPDGAAILDDLSRVLYPGLAKDLGPFVIRRKDGSWIEDVDGNVFLDLISGMASVPLGAANKRIMDAAVEALRRTGLEDAHFYAHEYMLPLAEQLLDVAPEGLTRVDISLNGTEAVETMIRFARRATGRPIVIGFMGGYHGEAGTAGAVGAETSDLSAGYRALMPGFVHVPYPNPYRSPFEARPGGTGDGTVDFIRDHLLFHAADPGEVAAIVIEPVLGSGGCVAPPPTFWTALTELCEEFGFLLAVDEVKSGYGRSGAMFAVQRWGVRPDLMALGKAMGGGIMPIGAVLGTERAMGFDDLSTGSTWSWFPASCAAALETLAVFRDEPVLDNVLALEAAGAEELKRLAGRFPAIGDVRSVGCFQAIELVTDRDTKERDATRQHDLAEWLARRGILADSSTTSLNIQPSLVLPVETLRMAYGVIEEELAAMEGAT